MFFNDKLPRFEFAAGSQLGFVGQRQVFLPCGDIEADKPAFASVAAFGDALLQHKRQHQRGMDAAGQFNQIAVVGDALFEIAQEKQVGFVQCRYGCTLRAGHAVGGTHRA